MTLGQAISSYLTHVALAHHEPASRELSQFGRWLGLDTPVDQLTAVRIIQYQETLAPSRADTSQRLTQLKRFLTSLHEQHATTVDLSAVIRLRHPAAPRPVHRPRDKAPEPVLMTEEGYARLSAELQDLEERVRPEVTEQLRSAAADKDFSENAPYSAAKHRLSEVRTRMNRIRRTLTAARVEIVESTDTVALGTNVRVVSLPDGEQMEYRIAGAGEPLGNGRISVRSPVGRALLGRTVGEEIDVETPLGLQRYRIDKIER